MDADDYWEKNKLKDQIKFMEKNSASFVHCSYFIVNEFNKIIGFRTAPKLIEYKALINSCDIGLSTVILEKNCQKSKFSKFENKRRLCNVVKVIPKKN